MTESAQLLFVGLPGSGKTTFLAALWHVLEERSGSTCLTLEHLSGDRTYLNQITDDWRKCLQVQRTKLEPEEIVTLHLKSDKLATLDLTIPDLSGEAFEALLTDRRMLTRHDELVQRAIGVILFVHPDVQKGTPLTYALNMEAALNTSVQKGDGGEGSTNTVVPWSIEKVPTQVKLVELLQFLLGRAQQKIRAAVIVSAWDLVDSHGTPDEYVCRTMPMLWQFLEANGDLLDYALFGVSAQGGDITDVEDKNALLDLDASERIKVRRGNEITHDITEPIAWLLGAN